MSQRRALDKIRALRQAVNNDGLIPPSNAREIDAKLQSVNAELIDDSKPRPGQDQRSTYDQMFAVYDLANANGHYDAADWIMANYIKPIQEKK